MASRRRLGGADCPTHSDPALRPVRVQVVRRNTAAATTLDRHTKALIRCRATMGLVTTPQNHIDQGAAMSDTPHPSSDLIHRIWISSVLFGLLATILGAMMLVWPEPSIMLAAGLFGVYL